jgi:sulfite reductase (NADPH) flavoprotein alpha-component
MFYYFGYGSNLSGPSLRAKGVVPVSAEPAVLADWRLTFDIPNFFAIEGGTGNISQSPGDSVHGVLYGCNDHALAVLDELEALGVAYRRTQMTVRTYSGREASAYVYVGLPDVTSEGLSPSRRYLNILIRGAEGMQLSPDYIDRLRRIETCLKPRYGRFRFPDEPDEVFTPERLATHPEYTAIAEAATCHRCNGIT